MNTALTQNLLFSLLVQKATHMVSIRSTAAFESVSSGIKYCQSKLRKGKFLCTYIYREQLIKLKLIKL